MSAKKILFASEYAGFIGGLERYIFDTASLLKRRGYKVYGLFAHDAPKRDDFLKVFDSSWNFSELDTIKDRFDLVTVHKIYEPENLRKLRERFRVTLFVHAHDYYCPKGYKYFPIGRKNCDRSYSSISCAICSSIVPPRQITDLKMFYRNFFVWPKLFSEFQMCSHYVVLSNFMRDQLEMNGIDKNKVSVIPPAIRVTDKRANGSKDGIPKIIFSGQQVMSKGTPLFLEVCKKIDIPFEANILGNGFRLDDFKNMSIKMGLGNKVHFRGWVDNVDEWLDNSDVFAFPSLWQEPFGLSGCEAMARGLPVVGFDVGGVSEWLKKGCGFLVQPRDTDDMANKLERILSSKQLCRELGDNARKYVCETFSEDKYVANIEGLM